MMSTKHRTRSGTRFRLPPSASVAFTLLTTLTGFLRRYINSFTVSTIDSRSPDFYCPVARRSATAARTQLRSFASRGGTTAYSPTPPSCGPLLSPPVLPAPALSPVDDRIACPSFTAHRCGSRANSCSTAYHTLSGTSVPPAASAGSEEASASCAVFAASAADPDEDGVGGGIFLRPSRNEIALVAALLAPARVPFPGFFPPLLVPAPFASVPAPAPAPL